LFGSNHRRACAQLRFIRDSSRNNACRSSANPFQVFATAIRAGFAQFLAFRQDAADNRRFLAQGKLQMPVLAFGGEATFGPIIGAVMRCVADNVEDVIIPDCGHWITEEQPQAATDLIVDFLDRRSRVR
jgi:pimeloyl-ACP methyl ester carboxylesterase